MPRQRFQLAWRTRRNPARPFASAVTARRDGADDRDRSHARREHRRRDRRRHRGDEQRRLAADGLKEERLPRHQTTRPPDPAKHSDVAVSRRSEKIIDSAILASRNGTSGARKYSASRSIRNGNWPRMARHTGIETSRSQRDDRGQIH